MTNRMIRFVMMDYMVYEDVYRYMLMQIYYADDQILFLSGGSIDTGVKKRTMMHDYLLILYPFYYIVENGVS